MNGTNFKACKNCRYYVERYIKLANGYSPIGGHCINDELNPPELKNKYKLHKNCNYWEPIEIQKSERRVKIKNTLREMAKNLDKIYTILKDDEY